MEKTVVVVDDHALTRTGIISIINGMHNFHVVATGAQADDVYALVKECKPTLLLLDLHMKYENGAVMNPIVEIERATMVSPTTRILIISGFLELHVIRAMFRSNIVGYLLKEDVRPDKLPTLLDQASQGVLTISPAVERYLHKNINRPDEWALLTERQIEIVNVAARNIDKSVSEIASLLSIKPQSLQNHFQRIYTILGVSNRAACVLKCIEMGYVRQNG